MHIKKKLFLGMISLLVTGGLLSACDNSNHQSSHNNSSKTAMTSQQTTHHRAAASSKRAPSSAKSTKPVSHHHRGILKKLIYYTNHEAAGPTGNYYWVTGKAHLTGFSHLKAGEYHFAADRQGRSGTARAVLTYHEYASSRGSRQGDPLAPPAWPDNNPRVAITYHLTGRTYHGYLYNRSHSIGDSLLGRKSYTSQYNFTTGTRPQNVGADQDGGMRYAEETAEDYWEDHPDTHQTISYETTPLYKGTETIPRGSIVNLKSSDGSLNTEVVVINSVEGIRINYHTGSSNAKPIRTTPHHQRSYSSHPVHVTKTPSSTTQRSKSTTKDGKWTVAAAGMVFVSDNHKYYSRVTNPGNYQYMSQAQASASGATRAIRGNQYAQP